MASDRSHQARTNAVLMRSYSRLRNTAANNTAGAANSFHLVSSGWQSQPGIQAACNRHPPSAGSRTNTKSWVRKCHRREEHLVIHRRPLAGVARSLSPTGPAARPLSPINPPRLSDTSQKAALCLLENPRCRHSVSILEPHKAAKM